MTLGTNAGPGNLLQQAPGLDGRLPAAACSCLMMMMSIPCLPACLPARLIKIPGRTYTCTELVNYSYCVMLWTAATGSNL